MNPPRAVYCYCPPTGPPDDNPYPHTMIAIAEGLRDLGVPVYSNVNYWRNSTAEDDYLLRHDPGVSPDECSAVVVENGYPQYNRGLPRDIFRAGRRYRTVYLDLDDGYPSRAFDGEYRQFDLVLRAHYNRRLTQPKNFEPWAFGLTNRILEATSSAQPPERRTHEVLVSYRVSHPVRTRATERVLKPLSASLPIRQFEDGFKPELSDAGSQLHWHQTGRRHNPAFYASLGNSAACAAFGGSLLSPKVASLYSPLGVWQRIAARVRPPAFPYALNQWDSFRLWESWAAGCATLHLDLANYGAVLPVMPRNWEHYIGIDLNRPELAVERLQADDGLLSHVAANGRAWAIEHYSPVAVARRFLRTVFGTDGPK